MHHSSFGKPVAVKARLAVTILSFRVSESVPVAEASPLSSNGPGCPGRFDILCYSGESNDGPGGTLVGLPEELQVKKKGAHSRNLYAPSNVHWHRLSRVAAAQIQFDSHSNASCRKIEHK